MRDFFFGITVGMGLAWILISIGMAWGTYTGRFALVVLS